MAKNGFFEEESSRQARSFRRKGKEESVGFEIRTEG